MKLETKIKIIQEAIRLLRDGETKFLCGAISSAHNSIINANTLTWLIYADVFKIYPEFLKHKPEVNYVGSVWFDCEAKGIKKRISICNKVIKELKSQL